MFNLDAHVPTLLVLGGSQGAQTINNNILEILPDLIQSVQVIHQSGKNNYDDVSKEASTIIASSPHKNRYHVFASLDEDQLRNASHMADVVVSRAGGNAIFEIAAWGIPSILIPIPLPVSAQDHQRINAYAYARSGAAEVIEEANLTPSVLLAEIARLLTNTEKRKHMKEEAQKFARLDAAEKVAREVIMLGLHQDE